MESNGLERGTKRDVGLSRLIGIGILFLALNITASAEVIKLQITGNFAKADFKTVGSSDKVYDATDPKVDGKVFGIAPLDGSVTLVLLVNTEGSVFFPKGTRFADHRGDYVLKHDFYGYQKVSLADGPFTFGNAAWSSDGILKRLDGPGDAKAALWTDVDITKTDPTLVSFRMFGKAEGLTADIFVGPRTQMSILGSFVLWEYYMGEEIRSNTYSARVERPLM